MKILIACEESQAGCIAFREAGYEAYSADLKDCSGGHPEWHIKGDVLDILDQGWDLMIGHPYCTYNTNAANRWLYEDSATCTAEERWKLRDEGLEFFLKLWNAPIPHICLENPQPHPYVIEKVGRFHDKIQPWMFGEPETKGLCLWLKNLPPLMSTMIETTREAKVHFMSPGAERSAERSKSYPNIMKAMVEQWMPVVNA